MFTYVLSLCWLVMTLPVLYLAKKQHLFKGSCQLCPGKCFSTEFQLNALLIFIIHCLQLLVRCICPGELKLIAALCFFLGSWGKWFFRCLCWCLSGDAGPVCEQWGFLCSKFPTQDLVWSSWQALVKRQPLPVCSAARAAGSSTGTALALSMFHRKQIFPRWFSESANWGRIGQCVTLLMQSCTRRKSCLLQKQWQSCIWLGPSVVSFPSCGEWKEQWDAPGSPLSWTQASVSDWQLVWDSWCTATAAWPQPRGQMALKLFPQQFQMNTGSLPRHWLYQALFSSIWGISTSPTPLELIWAYFYKRASCSFLLI